MQISVCIPAYNGAAFLKPCIESVLAQSVTDLELIFCDDASTDDTWDIVQSFRDPRIRRYRAERNSGMAANWDRAAGLAQGKYVKLLCQDDVLHPDCLKAQATQLDQHQDVIMVTSGRQLVDADGNPHGALRFFSREVALGRMGLTADMLVYGNIIGEPSAVLMRREGLIRAGAFSSTLPQLLDADMWLRLSSLGNIVYLPDLLCSIRRHPGMATRRNSQTGSVVDDMLAISSSLIHKDDSTWLARRIGWGRVAGSVVKQSLLGLAAGRLRWPARAMWRAFRADPGFFGFMASMILFRTGILSLRYDGRSKLGIGLGSTLNSSIESGEGLAEGNADCSPT